MRMFELAVPGEIVNDGEFAVDFGVERFGPDFGSFWANGGRRLGE